MKTTLISIFTLLAAGLVLAQDPKWEGGLRRVSGSWTIFSTNDLKPILQVTWPETETAVSPTNLDAVRIEASQKPIVKREQGKWVVSFEPWEPPATNNPARMAQPKLAHANKRVSLDTVEYMVHYDYELTSASIPTNGAPPHFEAVITVYTVTNRTAIGRPVLGTFTHAESDMDNPTNWVRQVLYEKQ